MQCPNAAILAVFREEVIWTPNFCVMGITPTVWRLTASEVRAEDSADSLCCLRGGVRRIFLVRVFPAGRRGGLFGVWFAVVVRPWFAAPHIQGAPA